MKYYVYEIEIRHPRLGSVYYVGKSKEPRIPGINYWGSCKYSQYLKWVGKYPKCCKILAEFETEQEQIREEVVQIKRCLSEHGAYLFGTYTKEAKVYRKWLDEYGKGTCLNGHWSSESGRDGLTKESHRAAVATRLKRGEKLIERLLSLNQTEAARKKRNQTKIELGQYVKWQQASCTPEAVRKQSETRRRNATKFRITFPTGEVKIGCQQEIFEFVSSYLGESWTSPLYRYCSEGAWIPTKGKLIGFKIEKLNEEGRSN